jgi:hypothetical protein
MTFCIHFLLSMEFKASVPKHSFLNKTEIGNGRWCYSENIERGPLLFCSESKKATEKALRFLQYRTMVVVRCAVHQKILVT